jgi:beta-lactam-binding protein with PASTA domain
VSVFSGRPWLAYVVTAVGGFTLAYLIVAIFIFPASAAERDASVPSVVGLQYADAQKRLEQLGFTVQRGELRNHTAAPRGSVLSQDPEPEFNAPPGSRITLHISNGPKVATVPGIIGLSREEAQVALEGAGFEMGQVSERPSNEPRGAVIDSRPRPGNQAPVPSPVMLVVSAGPTNIVVPDLTGRPLSDAFQLLRQVGLRAGEVKTSAGAVVPSPDMAAVVQSQTPIAGNQVIAGTRVDLTVGGRTP